MGGVCAAKTIIYLILILVLLYSFKMILRFISNIPLDQQFVLPMLSLLAIIYIFLFLIIIVDALTECL